MSLNYQEITDALTPDLVEQLLYKLGAEEVIKRDTYLITNTICHNESEGSLKLYYYYDTHLFVCYTSCQNMSPFNFLKHYYENRNIEYDWFKDIYCVLANLTNVSLTTSFDAPAYKSQKDKYERRNRDIVLPSYPDSILSIFSDRLLEEWIMEGISEESMEKYEIKYSISQNKIIIPHRDAEGRLVGIRGRALNKDEVEEFGKYMPIRLENKWYAHPLALNLYGLDKAREAINKTKRVIILEGEKGCLRYNDFYHDNNSVAVCGSNLHKTQINLLLKYTHATEVVIAFDKEYVDPWSEKASNYFNKLSSICKKYSQYYNFSFIFDREGLLDEKDSPVDKGKEVFEELMKKRVIVK